MKKNRREELLAAIAGKKKIRKKQCEDREEKLLEDIAIRYQDFNPHKLYVHDWTIVGTDDDNRKYRVSVTAVSRIYYAGNVKTKQAFIDTFEPTAIKKSATGYADDRTVYGLSRNSAGVLRAAAQKLGVEADYSIWEDSHTGVVIDHQVREI